MREKRGKRRAERGEMGDEVGGKREERGEGIGRRTRAIMRTRMRARKETGTTERRGCDARHKKETMSQKVKTQMYSNLTKQYMNLTTN